MTKTKKGKYNLSTKGKKTKKGKKPDARFLSFVKPNIYARNFRYADNENLADDGITRITQALKPTQWLRATSTIKEDDYKYKQGLSMKPEGLWYSKDYGIQRVNGYFMIYTVRMVEVLPINI